MNDDSELIGEVTKNSLERVRISVCTFKGHVIVDARIYVNDGTGRAVATKKGLCVAPDVLREMLPLLDEAQKRAAAKREQGE